ncbi:DNA relaxase NicK [Andreprevotia lacus DSM 23236]|jgi:phage replication initiation protein|uniref:DNA relaxase NicK n=1 Tax=Andreprevotia lacus DSM 23236 TaxID=1121001 RepID=A0A1W1Y1H4_9NEIS|nr:replication initiation factor domain-containing protein [Andreprevotia lacus]SMC29987.1 DNA relaxase NicK [Andreprevotia lacus DSM 23236]
MPRKKQLPELRHFDASLTGADFAAIDSAVAYTLSAENQARLALRDEFGVDFESAVTALMPQWYGQERRAARYDEAGVTAWAALQRQAGEAGRACATGLPAGQRETPTGNTGLTPAPQVLQLVISSGGRVKTKEYPVRTGPCDDVAFIDWVNFTFHKDTCLQYADFANSHEDYVLALSERLEAVFGFGVTGPRQSGKHFFHDSFPLGDGYGFVAIGGQRDRMEVSISGTGCTAAKPGWEQRLVLWLEGEAVNPKLTRVDLAHDDFFGERYSVDRADADYDQGAFQNYRGTAPNVEHVGNWKNPTGKGRTLTVGLRTGAKFLRVYERGRKEGARDSEWVRIEGEFKAVDCVLPYEMLLQPGKYLAGMYPALGWISERQSRVETHKRQLEVNLNASINNIKKQFGQYVHVLREVVADDAQLLDLISREGMPKRLKPADCTLAPAPLRLSDKYQGLTPSEVAALAQMGHIDFAPSYLLPMPWATSEPGFTADISRI